MCEWMLYVYLQPYSKCCIVTNMHSVKSRTLSFLPSPVTFFFQRLKFEIAEVMTEIEQLTCIGER